jgi:hypothetical protein
MTRIRRVSKEEWRYRILNAILLDTPTHLRRRDMCRANKARRKSVRAYRNPTPLLRTLKRDAASWIRQEGRTQAYKDALRQAREYQALKEPGLARRYRLLARVIKKSPGRKKVTGKTYMDKLIEDHGTTDAMSARGFILEDGTCLNLGQYDDHRIICGVYRNSTKAERKYGSRYGAFKALCKRFNMIRWIPESKMAEVFVPTTRQQDETLRDLADANYLKEVEVHRPRNNGTVMLEAEDGETLVRGINAILG